MEWFSTLSLALGSAWTSGINLYATVTIHRPDREIRLCKAARRSRCTQQLVDSSASPVDCSLSNSLPTRSHTSIASGDVIHTFIRHPGRSDRCVRSDESARPSIYITAFLIGGGLATAAHGSKAALRVGANFSPEPVTNWILSFPRDGIAIVASCSQFRARRDHVGARQSSCCFLSTLPPKVLRALRRMFRAVAGWFRGESFAEVARKAG